MRANEETVQEKTRRLTLVPKSLRRLLIASDGSEEARICAAIEIQRVYRGYLVRRSGVISYLSWKSSLSSHASSKQNVQSKPWQSSKATAISANVAERRSQKNPNLTKTQAVIKIQRFWRRHIDMQVYKYYRDLINFKAQGDPSSMLKCINPKESALLDAASGTHIKFRLAGEKFPPNIYYKIYTHRPIQDICANAPRNYTMSVPQKDMRTLHNKTFSNKSLDDKEAWYRRIENNGWRLVSDRLISNMLNDPVTWSTSNKQYHFPHSKILRKQDVERARKKKKIDWMRKMFNMGMLKAKADDADTVDLVTGAANGMINTVSYEGADAVAESEVDELLDWTTNLNFGDYISSWKQVGTSAISEKQAEQRMVISRDLKDSFSLNIDSSSQLRNNTTPQSSQLKLN